MKELIKFMKDSQEQQKNCKHKNKIIQKNIGDYKLRIQCKDCGKLIKYKFNK